ncbi:MAG: BadF/BadG/BcrA/BcrD ATPase family protein [Bryobacteraceae bacterium]|nr:BadF/BadG/BcrA/BcrD ATPase family protein [Bryobacteraceae bacterium]
MPLYLGVDGGQSSTTALIGDERGTVLGAGRGGPCNHVKGPEGRAKFIGAVRGCIESACRQAALDPLRVRFEAACLGFSGGPADKEELLEKMINTERLMVTHDGLIALSGATGGRPGIIVIAGTGSMAFGRNAAGRTARAGGWGYVFGDEGGAFDIVRQALRATLRHEEGWGPATSLSALLLEATGARDANDLMHRFYTTDYPRPKIAAYSRLVDQAAQDGDGVAGEVLKSAAQQLASYAAAARGQLFQEGDAVRIAHIGGVWRSGRVREYFRQILELDSDTSVGPPEYEPAAGALLEAYASAGLAPSLSGLPAAEKERPL